MLSITRLESIIFKPTAYNAAENLSRLRSDPDTYFYIYVTSVDNPNIKKPAFWRMPVDLKYELTILLERSVSLKFMCSFLHPLDIFIGSDGSSFYLDIYEVDERRELPERIYQLNSYVDQMGPDDLESFFSEQNSLEKYSNDYVMLTSKIISISDIYIGKKLEASPVTVNPIVRSRSVELDLANQLYCAAINKKGLNVNTYGTFAEKFLFDKYPGISSEAIKRISEVARPNALRKRSWFNKVKES